MGKLTISMAIFNSKLLVYQRVSFHWASLGTVAGGSVAVPVPDGARQLSGATPVTSLAALPGWQEVMGRVTWRKNDLLEQTGITMFNGKITIFYGKPMESHHF